MSKTGRTIKSFTKTAGHEKPASKISREEEIHLFKALEADDKAAAGRIVTGFQGLVGSIVKKRGLAANFHRADYLQEGSIGLVNALRKFDYRKGFRFSTLASTFVWRAVNKAARAGGASNDDLSLDAPISGADQGNSLCLYDSYAAQNQKSPEQAALDTLCKEELHTAMAAVLSAVERRVLRLLYCRELTLAEAGKVCNLSHQRIFQIKNNAFNRLRQSKYGPSLESYIRSA
jgi:RNA polymerase sigma factor (sigma-70 family)